MVDILSFVTSSPFSNYHFTSKYSSNHSTVVACNVYGDVVRRHLVFIFSSSEQF